MQCIDGRLLGLSKSLGKLMQGLKRSNKSKFKLRELFVLNGRARVFPLALKGLLKCRSNPSVTFMRSRNRNSNFHMVGVLKFHEQLKNLDKSICRNVSAAGSHGVGKTDVCSRFIFETNYSRPLHCSVFDDPFPVPLKVQRRYVNNLLAYDLRLAKLYSR
ncbi:hypothetical protein Ancab_027573 [Ancistrocladus abbreviatus]